MKRSLNCSTETLTATSHPCVDRDIWAFGVVLYEMLTGVTILSSEGSLKRRTSGDCPDSVRRRSTIISIVLDSLFGSPGSDANPPAEDTRPPTRKAIRNYLTSRLKSAIMLASINGDKT